MCVYVNKNDIFVIIYYTQNAIDTEIKFFYFIWSMFPFFFIYVNCLFIWAPNELGADIPDSLLESLIHGIDFLIFNESHECLNGVFPFSMAKRPLPL